MYSQTQLKRYQHGGNMPVVGDKIYVSTFANVWVVGNIIGENNVQFSIRILAMSDDVMNLRIGDTHWVGKQAVYDKYYKVIVFNYNVIWEQVNDTQV